MLAGRQGLTVSCAPDRAGCRVPHAAGTSLDVVDQNGRVIYIRPVDVGAIVEFGLLVFAGHTCLFLLAVLTAWWKQKH